MGRSPGRGRHESAAGWRRATVAIVAALVGAALVPVTGPAAAAGSVPPILQAGSRTTFPVACVLPPPDPEEPEEPEDTVCDPPAQGVAVAADGAVWATYGWTYPLPDDPPSIVRLDPATGTTQRFESPEIAQPTDIAAAPDGSLWFANDSDLGRITADGTITTTFFPFGGWAIGARQVAVAPDGTVWFSGRYTDEDDNWRFGVGRYDPATGTSTIVADPAIGEPTDLVVGPDGALWFSMVSAPDERTVGRVTAAGAVTTYATPGYAAGSITVGPDGALWFAMAMKVGDDPYVGGIGRITTGGAASSVVTFDELGATDLATGPDGKVWFRRSVTLDSGATLTGIANVTAGGVLATDTSFDTLGSYDMAMGPDGTLWLPTEAGRAKAIERVEVHGAPGPASSVTARPATARVTVAWEPPAFVGDDPITAYTATAQPSGQTCTVPAGQPLACDFATSTPGTGATYSVTATSASGTGVASPATVLPMSGSTYHVVPAARLLDSRTANGGWNATLAAGSPRVLQVTGRAGVPSSARAVVLNVTVTGVSAMTFVSAYPAGNPLPSTSSINLDPGDTRPNLVTVALGVGGQVAFANAVGAVHVVVDVVGYYDDGPVAGSRFNTMSPKRVLDTRVPGSHAGGSPLVAGATIDVPVMALAGLDPADANAVVVNITVTGATNDTFIRAWDPDDPVPGTSNVNVRAGDTVANLAVVGTGADLGEIRLSNAVGAAEVIVDVVGWFSADTGDYFHPIVPARVFDSRTDPYGPLGVGGRNVAVSWSGIEEVVPRGATGVVANLTITGATAESYLAAYPMDAPSTTTSSLNFSAGRTLANATYVGVGTQGFAERQIYVYNHLGSVEVIVDIAGYFSAS